MAVQGMQRQALQSQAQAERVSRTQGARHSGERGEGVLRAEVSSGHSLGGPGPAPPALTWLIPVPHPPGCQNTTGTETVSSGRGGGAPGRRVLLPGRGVGLALGAVVQHHRHVAAVQAPLVDRTHLVDLQPPLYALPEASETGMLVCVCVGEKNKGAPRGGRCACRAAAGPSRLSPSPSGRHSSARRHARRAPVAGRQARPPRRPSGRCPPTRPAPAAARSRSRSGRCA